METKDWTYAFRQAIENDPVSMKLGMTPDECLLKALHHAPKAASLWSGIDPESRKFADLFQDDAFIGLLLVIWSDGYITRTVEAGGADLLQQDGQGGHCKP